MYENLIKALRNVNEYDSGYAKLMYDAADAIEELQKAVYFHKYNSEFWEDKYNSLVDEKWIPVTERLPRMWEEVMLRFPNNQAVGFHDGDSGWAVFSGDNLYTYVAPEEVHPTHWMPLPDPPKGDE